MKIKTRDLIGRPLDWAVALCLGATDLESDGITWGFKLGGKLMVLAKGWAQSMSFAPSTDWYTGGPIIDDNGISVIRASSVYQKGTKLVCHVR